MAFQRVRTYQFRNLKDQEISLDDREIFLVGKNGQGKTNFLEVLYLLSYGSSFRTRQERQIPQHGKNSFSVQAWYQLDEEKGKVLMIYEEGKKTIKVDDQVVRDRKDLVKNMPCIVFSHEDFLFVKGPPERQRWFFDQTLSLYDEAFMDLLRNYKRVLKERTSLLRSTDRLSLEVYDERLAEFGHGIMTRRQKLVEEFRPLFARLFREISGLEEELEVQYLPSWKGKGPEDYQRQLESKRERDRMLGQTASGPHRDRFRFQMKGRNFSETASTGQVRLISLILRAAQAHFYREKTGRKPILLLDDVLLELDPEKRARFIERLPEYDQAIYTFLPGERVQDYGKEGSAVYDVEEGVLLPWTKTTNP